MSIFTTKELLKIPNEQGEFAVPAFNVHNMEYVQGVVSAAEIERSPVILMIGQAMIPFAGLDMLAAMCLHAAENTSVPVAVALDHGKDAEDINRCMELGLSIMFDGSSFNLKENIKKTRAICTKAHALGLSVEGELGSIGGSEDGEDEIKSMMTDPALVAEFVESTGVDILAISIGNVHGLYKLAPNIDIDRLIEIRKKVSIPIVMHGGSDLPLEISRAVIREGISKFNIGTDLKIAFSKSLRKALSNEPLPYQPPEVLAPARKAVSEVACQKMRDFFSSNKAILYE